MKDMNILTTNIFNEENLIVLKSLIKNYPNDADLGKNTRNLFRFDSLVKSLPNDRELGSEIRKCVINFSK